MKKAMFMMLAMGAVNEVSATESIPELIRNGDFAINECTQEWCISNQSNYVQGWIPDPELEVGYGHVYSDVVNNERVL